MSGIPMLVVFTATFVITGVAALGFGSRVRRVGYRLPWVSDTAKSWVSSHRAAFVIVGPTAAVATALHIIGSTAVPVNGSIITVAGLIWLAGVLVGGGIAMARARTLAGQPHSPA